jgi:hypothetical protein
MMKNTITKFVGLTIMSVLMAASLAFAADKDTEKNQSTPPGWEQGEKTGWQGDTPPGLTEDELQKKKKAGKKSGKHKADAKKEAGNAQQKAGLKKEKAESEMELEKEKSLEEIEKKKKKLNNKEG